MAGYGEKLKDPRWQKKRLGILDRDGWECRCCGANDKTLHVHHAYYVSGREPWDYPNESLAAVCVDCHHDGSGEDEWLMLSMEHLIKWICEIAPEEDTVDSALSTAGIALGEAGQSWRSSNRRRLTGKEWMEFWNEVGVLLEAKFGHKAIDDQG